jgi:hypothetical protein
MPRPELLGILAGSYAFILKIKPPNTVAGTIIPRIPTANGADRLSTCAISAVGSRAEAL